MDLKAMTVKELLDEYWKPQADRGAAGPADAAWLHKLWRIDLEMAERTGHQPLELLVRGFNANEPH